MSTKEMQRRKVAAVVMREAWALKKRTTLYYMNIGAALMIAWKAVRSMMRYIYTKVRGTTYTNRQKLLRRLLSYDNTEIVLSFNRDHDNVYDRNAIAIMATVKGKGESVVGYLSKELASVVAPLMDSGGRAVVMFNGITGGSGYNHLGCNLKFIII